MKEVLTFLLSCLCIYSVQGQSNSNETCLNFGELPRVTSRAEPAPTLIENGLRAWARLPQAFVDATGRRGLPIGKYIEIAIALGLDQNLAGTAMPIPNVLL